MYTTPPSFHPVWLIKYLLFSKQITLVNLQSSATKPYPPVLFISRVQRPIDFFYDSQTRLSAFTPAAVPDLSLCFGLIWRTRENNGEKRVSKEWKCFRLTSHLSTKKSFSPSLQWGTNLAHGSLRLSHQCLVLWVELGTCKGQLQPLEWVRETTQWLKLPNQGVSAILPGAPQTLRQQIQSWCLRINFWTMRSDFHFQLSIGCDVLVCEPQSPGGESCTYWQ